jgi:hypothetical protein
MGPREWPRNGHYLNTEDTMPIIEGTTSDPLLHSGAPSNGVDEVQLITYTATIGTNVPDSGTFTISFDGYTTTAIAYDATDAVVQAALRALPSIGALGVSVTVAAGPPRVYTVTFDGGNMLKRAWPLMTTTSSMLQVAAPVTAVVTENVAGVSATGLGSAVGKVLLRTDNGAQYYNTGTALAPVWTPLAPVSTTSSTAELNLIDGSVAGTAVASKALVLGANKNVDTLAIADSGLKLGAGAGTAVTATAAEINAAASTAGIAAAKAADGLHDLGVARFTFDPTATAGMRTQGAHGLGVTLPAQAIVVGGFFDVNAVFTSTNSNSTIAISVQGANDIQTAAAVSGAPYSTIGRKAIVPKANTPESTSVKTSAAKEITATVAVEDLLGGKLTGFLYYVVSVASA